MSLPTQRPPLDWPHYGIGFGGRGETRICQGFPIPRTRQPG
jgi:hypothetical protein